MFFVESNPVSVTKGPKNGNILFVSVCREDAYCTKKYTKSLSEKVSTL